MKFTTCIAAALFASVLCVPEAVAEQDVRGTGETVPGSYIVVLEDGVDASPQTLASRYRGTLKRTYRTALSGFSVRDMTEQQARRLAADPAVDYVQRNLVVSGSATQPNAPWNLDRIDQRALPLDRRYTYPDNGAANVRAYVLDSGVRITHEEFEGRASHGFDFIDDDATRATARATEHTSPAPSRAAPPVSPSGHGSSACGCSGATTGPPWTAWASTACNDSGRSGRLRPRRQ